MDKKNTDGARKIIREAFVDFEKETKEMFGEDWVEDFDQITKVLDALEQVNPTGLN